MFSIKPDNLSIIIICVCVASAEGNLINNRHISIIALCYQAHICNNNRRLFARIDYFAGCKNISQIHACSTDISHGQFFESLFHICIFSCKESGVMIPVVK